jgi:hypothetical protein
MNPESQTPTTPRATLGGSGRIFVASGPIIILGCSTWPQPSLSSSELLRSAVRLSTRRGVPAQRVHTSFFACWLTKKINRCITFCVYFLGSITRWALALGAVSPQPLRNSQKWRRFNDESLFPHSQRRILSPPRATRVFQPKKCFSLLAWVLSVVLSDHFELCLKPLLTPSTSGLWRWTKFW